MKKLIKLEGPKQKGFTLIELVMVIVVLGVLAAVALPKFIDLSTEARDARAKALAVAISSGATANFAKLKSLQASDPSEASWPSDFNVFHAGLAGAPLDSDVTRILPEWSSGGDPSGMFQLENPTGECIKNHTTINVVDIKTGKLSAVADLYCETL